MKLNQILIDKKNQLTVGELKKKYNLTDEEVFAIMECLDKDAYANDEYIDIMNKLTNLKVGMK